MHARDVLRVRDEEGEDVVREVALREGFAQAQALEVRLGARVEVGGDECAHELEGLGAAGQLLLAPRRLRALLLGFEVRVRNKDPVPSLNLTHKDMGPITQPEAKLRLSNAKSLTSTKA